jgi:hypothetical protein
MEEFHAMEKLHAELFSAEHCPDCGDEVGFGPCSCGVRGPEPHPPFDPKRVGSMREMVTRKLARRVKA